MKRLDLIFILFCKGVLAAEFHPSLLEFNCQTQLKYAINAGLITHMELLLEIKPNILDISYDNFIPLHEAIKSEKREIIKLMVESKAKVNAVDHEGNTALIYAGKLPNLDVVKFLIGHKANIDHRNLADNSLFDIAVHNKNLALAEFLIKAGCKITDVTLIDALFDLNVKLDRDKLPSPQKPAAPVKKRIFTPLMEAVLINDIKKCNA